MAGVHGHVCVCVCVCTYVTAAVIETAGFVAARFALLSDGAVGDEGGRGRILLRLGLWRVLCERARVAEQRRARCAH